MRVELWALLATLALTSSQAFALPDGTCGISVCNAVPGDATWDSEILACSPVSFKNVVLDRIDPKAVTKNFLECTGAVANCACDLLGAGSCNSLKGNAQATIATLLNDDDNDHKTELRAEYDTESKQITLHLDYKSLDTVSGNMQNYKNRMRKINNGHFNPLDMAGLIRSTKELEDKLFMDKDAKLRQLALSLLFLNVAEMSKRELEWAENSPTLLKILTFRRMHHLTEALNACEAQRDGKETSPNSSADLSLAADLTCLMRTLSEAREFPLYSRWSGCHCSPSTKNGRRTTQGTVGTSINGACVSDWFNTSIRNEPIDSRVPAALFRYISKMNTSFAPYRVKGVALMGCSSLRFESGPNVTKSLKFTRTLRTSHFSEHAKGDACDVAAVTFVDEKCNEHVLNFTAYDEHGAKTTPYKDALDAFTAKYGKDLPKDTGDRYRELQSRIFRYDARKSYPALTDNQWFNLIAGVKTRNALVDVGMIVFDPSVNAVHADHLHFTLPDSRAEWAMLACKDGDHQCVKNSTNRETIIRPYIQRARGEKPE